jgi:hypothetical protein
LSFGQFSMWFAHRQGGIQILYYRFLNIASLTHQQGGQLNILCFWLAHQQGVLPIHLICLGDCKHCGNPIVVQYTWYRF